VGSPDFEIKKINKKKLINNKSKIMKKLIVLGLILVLGNLTFLAAQTVGNWENYVNPERLTGRIETVNEIWFSSKAGVFKMDKTTLQVTNFNPANSNIPSSSIEGIAKDANGFIWIGTYDQAIAKFDGTNWTHYSYPDNLFNTTNFIQTYCIEVDNQGIVWVGTSEGLVSFDGTNWSVYSTQLVGNLFHDVWALELDNQGNIYAASFNVYRFDGTNFHNMTDTTNISIYGGAILFKASNGDIWVNTLFGVIGVFDGTTWTEYSNNNGQIPFNETYQMGETPNGEIYFTCQDSGKYVLQNGIWQKQTIVDNPYVSDNQLVTYFFDNQGNEWLGNGKKLVKNNGQNLTLVPLVNHGINNNNTISVTEFNGVKYILSSKEIVTFDGTNWGNLTLPTTTGTLSVRQILFETSGNIWLCTSKGIWYWDGSVWSNYSTLSSINKIAWDESTQTMWGATTNGLAKFEGTNVTYFNQTNSPLTDDYIRAIALDNNGILHVSTAGTQGDVFRYDGTTFINLSTGATAPQFGISTIHFDKNNTLWAGSWYGGIYKFDGFSWTNWNVANSDLPRNNIWNLISDGNGKIYIATDGGVATFDGTNWEVWTTSNSGLCNNIVRNLELDATEKLWMATSHGVSTVQLTLTNTNPIIFENTALKVFPNPITDKATLQFDLKNTTEKIRISVISLDGKTISDILIEGQRTEGWQQLEIYNQGWSSGLYYLQVQYNEVKMVQPILVR
jgi:ligand-binding sensor domain-containing protein